MRQKSDERNGRIRLKSPLMRRKEEAIILPAGIGSDGGVVGERDREIEGESSARDSNK